MRPRIIALLYLAGCIKPSGSSTAGPRPPQPNILLFLSDDLTWQALERKWSDKEDN